jgi:hypothetical protein
MIFSYDPVRAAVLKQKISCTRSGNIAYVRPYLYKQGSPGGNIKFQLFDASGFLIKETNDFLISTISLFPYTHGVVRLVFNYPLREGQDYFLGIAPSTGYTYSPANHVGLVRGNPDLRKATKAYAGLDEFVFELWERNTMTREIDFFDGFESSSQPESGEQFAVPDATGPADITGLSFDSNSVHRARVAISIFRRNDSVSAKEEAVFEFSYDPEAATWQTSVEGESNYGSAGVSISITAAGQVQYTSTSFAGVGYSGYLIFQEIISTKAGV